MVLEIGYNEPIEGQEVYKAYEDGKPTRCYSVWNSMLQRCYNPKFQEKNPNWIGWTVAEEWHNFQNFAKWYENNYYEIEGQRVVLDKDLLGSSSRVCSADTCCFLPNTINRALIGGKGYCFNKLVNKYQANIKYKGTINLGYFDTEEEARYTYKLNKQLVIYLLAEEYKEYLPVKVYDTLMDYRMEVDEIDEVDDDVLDIDDTEVDIDELDEELVELLVAIKKKISDRTNDMNVTELLNEMANYSSALDDDCNENRDIHKLYIAFLNAKLQRKLG